jgi:hypothetical protein
MDIPLSEHNEGSDYTSGGGGGGSSVNDKGTGKIQAPQPPKTPCQQQAALNNTFADPKLKSMLTNFTKLAANKNSITEFAQSFRYDDSTVTTSSLREGE